ncbi:MAG: hypothetical protein NE334_12085 [Lentisphaeraceae bacterium]|nr:hypothetical protein [Lentisphaeraceae bacterium]
MKELFLAGALALSGAAIYSTVSVVKYTYAQQDLKDASFVPVERESTPEEIGKDFSTDVIYNKNAFEASRGKSSDEDTDGGEEETTVNKGSYTFEIRGIIGVGEKQVALFSAKLNGRSSSTRGRTKTRSTVSSNSNKIYICGVGDKIAESDYKIKSIKAGLVEIEDSSNNKQSFEFSLASDESIERSEVAFKNEVSRQKSFAKQNSFTTPKPPVAPTKKPTTTTKKPEAKLTPEEQAKKREEDMRARATKLKEEMKRLKKLRDDKKKSDK